ncbi:hypothetical protein [Nitratireductor basaltis]|nr:hypothetical protein [Nitratireductor basaltis]
MISQTEEAVSWLAYVEREDERSALAAWCRCAATKGLHFKAWCRKQGSNPKTGRARKNRALMAVYSSLARSDMQNNESKLIEGFLRSPASGQIDTNIADEPDEARGVLTWRSDAAFTSIITDKPADFSWAQKRWERRKQKQAAKRKQEAA